MSKKAAITFACIYLFLYMLNYLHPMSFGDDYLYSFIWQGKPMFVPLSEYAVRVSSWQDLFVSQWSHYLTWSGRVVAHVLIQFFLWIGKDIFNFFNAFIGTLLVAEIYWCINKGRVTFSFDSGTVCWIFFVLWAFTPGFSPVFFWLTAACNYLWTNVILLGFLIPYVKKYYMFDKKNEKTIIFALLMFCFGILAGWTNENSVCWIILVLMVFVFECRKKETVEKWMYTGLAGLMSGYALLMSAPGNVERMRAEHGLDWNIMQALPDNFRMLLAVLLFQLLLWYFVTRSVFSLKSISVRADCFHKEMLLVKILCSLAFGMTAIMLLSPFFPPRSGFSGTIYLIIASGILLRIQTQNGIELIQDRAKKFLFSVGVLYFLLTASVTLQHFYRSYNLINTFIKDTVQKEESYRNIVDARLLQNSNKKEDIMSGFHTLGFELSEDENNWINVAFARYYGIKGIRLIKDESEKETIKTEAIPTESQSR